MSFIYNAARLAAANDTLDWAGEDFNVLLVMSDTDIDDATLEHLGDEGTLDEFDGVGYGRQSVSNRAVSASGAEASYTNDAVLFPALQDGTRQIQAGVLYRTSDDLLVAYIDDGLPINPVGRSISLASPLMRMT